MSAITEFARGRPCTMRLTGICNHNPETSVWAHINSVRWGSGKGQKCPDIIGLIVCSDCHDVLDRRVKTLIEREFVMLAAYEGHCESLALLVKEGVI